MVSEKAAERLLILCYECGRSVDPASRGRCAPTCHTHFLLSNVHSILSQGRARRCYITENPAFAVSSGLDGELLEANDFVAWARVVLFM